MYYVPRQSSSKTKLARKCLFFPPMSARTAVTLDHSRIILESVLLWRKLGKGLSMALAHLLYVEMEAQR